MKIHKIKVAQDEPITITHLQHMHENNEMLRRFNSNQVFSTTWNPVDQWDSGVDFITPRVTFQGGCNHYEIHIIANWGSASETFDLIFSVGNNDYEVTSTFTGSVSLSLRTAIINIEGTALDLQEDKSGYLTLENCSDSVDMYYCGIFAEFGDYESTSPQIGDPATDVSLLTIVEALNKASYKEKFILGWIGSESLTYHAYPYTTTPWSLFHWFDEADDNTSTTKKYKMTLGILSAGACDNYTYLKNSAGTSTVLKTIPVGTNNWIHNATNSSITQVSADDATPYSNPSWNFFMDNSGAKPLLKSFALTAQDSRIATARNHSLNGTSIDPAYYDIAKGEDINNDIINTIGQIQFNNLFLKAGNISAMAIESGRGLSLTSSYKTAAITGLYSRSQWFTGIKSNIYGYYQFNICIKNTGSTATFYFNNANYGDSTNFTKSVAAGETAYITVPIFLERDDTFATVIEMMTLTIKTSIATTATIYSISYSPMLTTETY